MQLAASRELPRLERVDHHGLRRLVRAAAVACMRHVRLRSLVVIVERHGHARMASWATTDVSRLDVGIAEARAFQQLMRGEHESPDPRVVVVRFPRDSGSLRGLVRFESADPIDERERAALGIEALRLAVTIDTAEALAVGDCALPPDRPAAALVAADGSVLSSSHVFDALAPGAEVLDELGTTMRDRDALRRVLDEAAVASGRAHQATLRIGPTARNVIVRCASPLPDTVLVMILDLGISRRSVLAPHPLATRLPHALIDRATLDVLDGNDAGRRVFEGLVPRIAPRARLTLLSGMVDADAEPSWIGPLPLLDGRSLELAVIASEHHGVPAVVALAVPST